ncbi:MAG: hypothetical protein M3324_00710, partial [Actinomycetota bacterium]|nr:hypothetical protein [Actinomycetota bacterium]
MPILGSWTLIVTGPVFGEQVKFLCSLSCKLLLSGQLLRYVQSALSLGANVVDHRTEELFNMLSNQLLGHHGAIG